MAVPGQSKVQTATRLCQTDAGLFCHVAAPRDGRTPAAGGNVAGVGSAKVLAHGHHASAALAASVALPENLNCAVKSSFLLSFLESVPDVANRFKTPVSAERKFDAVVKSEQDAAVLVLVF
jgi:hypothetical protein